jgi:hypothetical protein
VIDRRPSICVAALIVTGFAPACQATTPATGVPQLAAREPTRTTPPRSDVWIAYAPNGLVSTSAPNVEASETVTVGHSRPPIFSVRLRSIADDGVVKADLLTPAGFDRRYVRAEDIREDAQSSDSSSDAAVRALIHHRPTVRINIDAKGNPHVEDTPELRRHEACRRRLLRAATEARLATPSSSRDDAALLLRTVMLPLPASADGEKSQFGVGVLSRVPDQSQWRAEQIRFHGRHVRLELNLLTAETPAASLCRSLALQDISEPRRDTCTIAGVIDQRDKWPITLTISRKGKAADGATESHSRTFDRITPLQGFVPPANPCAA